MLFMSNRIKETLSNIFREREKKIEPNIWKLPANIGKYKVIFQYTPPEWLSPCEVWFLYYKKFQSTDLDSILYDWTSKWYISIKNSGTYRSITNNKTLKSEKEYERYCRHLFFWYKEGDKRTLYLRNLIPFFYGDKIWEKILNYCSGKWWLTYETKNYLSRFLIFVYLWIPLITLWFVLCSLAVGGSIIWWLVFLFFASLVIYVVGRRSGVWINRIKSIKLTDEWEKLLADIYWYKYYLEKCEEEQFKESIKEDPTFLDKTLPYIIALRLNSYFLKNHSIFHHWDISFFSKFKIYIVIFLLLVAIIILVSL